MKYIVHQERELQPPRKLSGYIRDPKTSLLIAREPSFQDMSWYAQKDAALKKGTPMASVAIFLPYRNKVIEAAQGGIGLRDGEGRRISLNDAKQLASLLTENCCVNFDTQFFENSKGKMQVTYLCLSLQGDLEQVTEPLQWKKNIHNGNLVDLQWNHQGMPMQKSGLQEFDPQNNMYVYEPFDGSVPWFGADAYGAYLGCDGGPRDSDGGLGTLVCAAGAEKILRQ